MGSLGQDRGTTVPKYKHLEASNVTVSHESSRKQFESCSGQLFLYICISLGVDVEAWGNKSSTYVGAGQPKFDIVSFFWYRLWVLRVVCGQAQCMTTVSCPRCSIHRPIGSIPLMNRIRLHSTDIVITFQKRQYTPLPLNGRARSRRMVTMMAVEGEMTSRK